MKKTIKFIVLCHLLFYSSVSIAEIRTFAEDLLNPTGLAIHPAEEALYVKSGTTGKVWAIPIEGDGSAGKIALRTEDFTPDMQIVFDAAGNLYGLESEHIYRLSAAGHVEKTEIGALNSGVAVENPGLPSNKLFLSHTPSLKWIDIKAFSPGHKMDTNSYTSCGTFRFLNYRQGVGGIVGTYKNSLININPTEDSCATLLTGFVQPSGIAEDKHGNLYVADTGAGTITQLTPLGQTSIIASGLSSPTGLAYHPKTRLLFVSETANARVRTISLDNMICTQVITYARNPITLNWFAFPTPCDVPTGWTISQTKPKGFKPHVPYNEVAKKRIDDLFLRTLGR